MTQKVSSSFLDLSFRTQQISSKYSSGILGGSQHQVVVNDHELCGDFKNESSLKAVLFEGHEILKADVARFE